MKRVLDLKQLFGSQYQIERDPAFGSSSDPAGWVIPGRKDCAIFAHDDRLLAAEIFGTNLCNKTMAIPGVQVHQTGEQYCCVLFPVELFDVVARVVKPKRRRRQNDVQRQANAERLRKWQFKPGKAPAEENSEEENPDGQKQEATDVPT